VSVLEYVGIRGVVINGVAPNKLPKPDLIVSNKEARFGAK